MGGKSGGGQSTPYEAPNTLSSAQSLRIIDAISEGVVSGFANGDDAPFKSVFFDDTPVQNADGSFNYKGVVGFFQRGLQEQTYVPGFDASERTVAVSAGVKQNTPIVRTVTDALVTRLRITVGVERNAAVQDNGDTLPANTSLQVELVNNQGVKAGQVVAFTEKGSGIYYQDVLFDTLPAVPFNIRVTRISPDSTTDRISNNTYFASYVEIIDAKLSYPHTAFAALAIDSDQFGNSVPRRNYLLKGRLVKVPSNYDPETRIYSGTTWDGSFKTAWTNNPAWVFYDVLTQPRFSTLARRLNVADIDKWSLYQIGRYCDELVDDGFGGKEPRFVCNAYISDLTQAGEFLLNLASVFTGLPVWNGSQISVVMDADSDPVALYNNSNVKDGLFTYSGAAYKSIHTAVHIQYIDKYDGYRTKTEYIADNDAVARYGLNIKQITSFGCDSRGQAARFGAWTLQTELRQQNMVSFEVGREGLKHLPYDIVQVMDNQYAGAELSGRIAAVDGLTVTLDRDVPDIAGALFYYSGSDGLKSVKVAGWPAKNQVLLESADGISAGAGWAVGGKVKPRLFRAIGIKENSSDGTYTITGLLHDPKKYAAVDSWANFDREITTLHNIAPVLVNGNIATESGAVVISWDNLTASGQVLTYDIKIYRNNRLYRHTPDAKTAEIRLENLPNGDYKAEIRGRNARGSLSEPLIKAWLVDYNITGLRATPKTLAIAVDWVLPQTVVSELISELWYSRSNDFKTAVKLASLPYPQNSYQLTGVGVSDTYYFWARAIDTAGNSGEFTAAVKGQADKDPAPIVAQVQGAITKSALSKDLIAALNADMATAADSAKQAAIRDAAAKVAAETQQRTQAIQAEAASRTTAIKVAAEKAASDLSKTATDLGTKITAVENVNATQAQQISTVTAAQGQTAAGLEAEKKARADGDKAEAAARATLATRVGNAESNITKESQARTAADTAQVQETNALKTRVGSAEGRITTLQETVAENDRAATTKIENLTAQFGALAVGGRNMLKNSNAAYNSAAYSTRYELAEAPKVGEDVVITLWGSKGSDRTGIGVYNSHGFTEIAKLVEISEGVYQGKGKWSLPMRNGAPITPNNTHLNVYFYPNGATSANTIDRIKLERGNVGTDWTPAPEDTPDDVVTTATFESYKTAQAAKDKAQTDELNTAKSSIAGNTSEIANLKSTAATKDQVVSMARNGLQAEWRGYADSLNNVEYVNTKVAVDLRNPKYYAVKPKGTYKELILSDYLGIQGFGFLTVETVNAYGSSTHVTQRAVSSNSGLMWTRSGKNDTEWNNWQRSETTAGAEQKAKAAQDTAVTLAALDAQQKADAAKAAADVAAQAKADAAKAQAIAAASDDAAAKANAAKAQAIADAAAKDAAIKKQAADDATAKADAAKAQAIATAAADAAAKSDKAKADAIAESHKLYNAADARIISLDETVTQKDNAMSRRVDNLGADLHNLGGVNLLVDSEFKGYLRWGSPVINNSIYLGRNLLNIRPNTTNTGQFGVVTNVDNARTRIEAGKTYTLSFNVQGTAGIQASKLNYVYLLRDSSEGGNFKLENISITASLSNRVKVTFTAPWTSNTVRLLIAVNGTFAATDWFAFHSVKLERGSVATDWSATPVDLDSYVASVSADITAYKAAQTKKEAAWTEQLDSHKVKLEQAESEISTLKRTSITSGQAETIANDRIRASNQFADTRNDNRPPTWYWTNHPRQTVREFKVEWAVGAGTGTTFCAVETVVPWANGSGGAITQTAYMNDGTVKRRKSDVTYTYSNNSYNYTKDAWTAWETDETVKGAKSKADAVKAIADAADRLSKKTDADFTQFKTAYANAELARAAKEEELTAKIENIQVGGLNLLKNSNAAYNSAAYSTRYELAEAPKVGEDVVITLWGSKGSDRTGIGVYNSHGFTEIAKLVEISEGVYQGKGKWSLPMRNGAPITPNNTHLDVYFYPNGATSANTIDRIKLERGTVGTDWTPAPEDASTDTTAKVKVVSDAVANLNGKVQAMHTVKVEAISGGRKVISGLALGADGQTGDSQMLVYANKFAIVDPTSKSLNTPFVVVTENGKSKVALDGDLIAAGTVHGKHISAGAAIDAPVINGATVNAGLIVGSTIRGAKIEAVDLEAANIVGDVVAVRSFAFSQSPLGYQELVCQIPNSRKSKRTLIVPQVLAVSEDGASVDLGLYLDGVLQSQKVIQSPNKTTSYSGSHPYSAFTPTQNINFIIDRQVKSITIPSVHIQGQIPVSFTIPYSVPKTGGVALTRQIDGAAHSVHILCRVNGNFNYEPLGDVSGIVCFII